MLIDEFLPTYEFSERHKTVVPAPPDVVRRAVDEWRPEDSTLWRVLVRLRGMGRPAGSIRDWAASSRFICLADTPDELVFGIAGRFWDLTSRSPVSTPQTAEDFRAFNDPTSALAVMNIALRTTRSGRTRLSTETRIHPLSGRAKTRFRLYWLAVGPFSALLRRSMLSGIKAKVVAQTSQPEIPEGT
jgi:hypothetical protein